VREKNGVKNEIDSTFEREPPEQREGQEQRKGGNTGQDQQISTVGCFAKGFKGYSAKGEVQVKRRWGGKVRGNGRREPRRNVTRNHVQRDRMTQKLTGLKPQIKQFNWVGQRRERKKMVTKTMRTQKEIGGGN